MSLVSTLRALRLTTATVIAMHGLLLVGSLWFRELQPPTLFNAVLGAVYLIISLGLYGRSRLSLFVAVIVPAAGMVWLPGRQGGENFDWLERIGPWLDFTVITGSLAVLGLEQIRQRRLRNN
jgi:hypothetical protein